MDQIHNGAAVAFIFRRCNVATRLVENEVARTLGAEQVAIDANDRPNRIGSGAQLSDNNSVDRHPTSGDHCLSGTARGDAACGENSLQSFHRVCSDAT